MKRLLSVGWWRQKHFRMSTLWLWEHDGLFQHFKATAVAMGVSFNLWRKYLDILTQRFKNIKNKNQGPAIAIYSNMCCRCWQNVLHISHTCAMGFLEFTTVMDFEWQHKKRSKICTGNCHLVPFTPRFLSMKNPKIPKTIATCRQKIRKQKCNSNMKALSSCCDERLLNFLKATAVELG